MKLQVKDRLILLGVLPKEGDFTTLKIIRDLQEGLSFTEKEHKEYKFVQEGTNINWDSKADAGVEIKIGGKAKDIITDALKKMSEQKKLTLGHMELYEMFVGKGKA